MSDLVLCQIPGIIFPILDLDQLQDLFPDLDLVISIHQLNVNIVTAWFTQQTIVSDVKIEMSHIDNLIKVGKIITEILINDIQTTGQILDTGLPILLIIG